jgi:hypothetical protein
MEDYLERAISLYVKLGMGVPMAHPFIVGEGVNLCPNFTGGRRVKEWF